MSKSKMTLGTLYDFNKQLMSQAKELRRIDFKDSLNQIKDFIKEKDNKYFMLLCKERSDYTVFVLFKNEDFNRQIFKKELSECLINRGQILSIERTKDKQAYEIWIKIDEEAFVYYLFPYDLGVIEVKKD
jgi:hypothetical protein